MSTAKKLFWSAFIAALVMGLLFAFWNPKKEAPVDEVKNTAAVEQPCTKQACIEIKLADGSKFQLNDFRFLPDHCIMFIEFPNNKEHSYCGEYDLQWIGPDGSEQAKTI
jgi:hypothetical protein